MLGTGSSILIHGIMYITETLPLLLVVVINPSCIGAGRALVPIVVRTRNCATAQGKKPQNRKLKPSKTLTAISKSQKCVCVPHRRDAVSIHCKLQTTISDNCVELLLLLDTPHLVLRRQHSAYAT
jgi:hypothetical protein